MATGQKKAIVAAVASILAACVLSFVLTRACGTGQQEGSPATAEQATTTAQDSPDETGTSEVDLTTSTAPVGENARDAQTSADVPTTTQVYEEAETRGFGDTQVQASFDLQGTYHDPTTLDEASEEAYPSYHFPYTSAQGVYWIIYVNDGNYLAVPFSRGGEVLSHQVVFSERDYITQYDGLKNEYSDFALDELTDGIVGVRVDSVDAATLDTYTFEQLEAM